MLNSSEYNIQIIPCKAKRSERTAWIADHNFVSPTYQNELKRQIFELKKNLGLINENNR